MAQSEPVVPVTARLRSAFGLAAGGAVLLVVGPLVGVVDPSAPPALTSWPLLAVLAVLPVLIAGVFLVRGRTLAAGGVLAAAAVFAPGRALVDLQIAADPLYASRPELFRPVSLDVLPTAPGLWLLVAGHVLATAAGVLAAGRHGVPVESADAEDEPGRRGRFAGALVVGLLAGIGLLVVPFTSTDVYLFARGPMDSPEFAMLGGILVAAAAPLAGALAASSPVPAGRRGGLLGAAAAITAISLPPLVTALVTDGLDVSWGPVLALLAAGAFAVLSRPLGREDTTAPPTATAGEAPAVELAGQHRLQIAAGIVGVLAGLAAVGGALGRQLVLPEGLPTPVSYADRQLWPAGIAVGVLGLLTIFRSSGSAVRPAFTASLAALPLAGTAALDAVLAATRIGSVQPGAGAWLTVLSLVLGLVAAGVAGLAGAVEREELGRPEVKAPLTVLVPVALAGLFALGAFSMPALVAPDLTAPVIWDFRVASWGLLIGLLSVLAAAVLAAASRSSRAAALLLGAAVVAGVRALELPLTGARAAGSAPGPGTWLALACTVALVVAAVASAARR
jgi:hypothetical protein